MARINEVNMLEEQWNNVVIYTHHINLQKDTVGIYVMLEIITHSERSVNQRYFYIFDSLLFFEELQM